MVKNFIREFKSTGNKIAAGFYGDRHADPSDEDTEKGTHLMAYQLKAELGDIIRYDSIESLVRNRQK